MPKTRKKKKLKSKVQYENNNKGLVILLPFSQAKAKGYSCFAIQFYGECWSGPDCQNTYAKHGSSSKCTPEAPLVGKRLANYVYMITTGLKQ